MSAAQTYTRHDVSFASGKDTCAAWLYIPAGVTSPPVVILGHGLGATREMRLDAFAARFAQAGIAALAFTYRHFGDSAGQPRQLLSIRRQLADWDAAIAWVKNRPDVDGTRIAVWGSSFGGGHSITVASRHPELRAAVAQCPFTDGLASALALGPTESLRVLPTVARDFASMVFRRPPAMIPLAGPPGSLALMNAPDALPGYEALLPTETTFRNEVAARVAPAIATYRPGRAVKTIKFPILFCVSNTDSVTPPTQTLRYAHTAPRGEIKRYDAGHFDFYLGKPFEELVNDQIEFLSRHLKPADKKDHLRAAHTKGNIGMTSLLDPLKLPCGLVLPNRIMKAALSEGLGDKQNSPDERLERLYTSWSHGGYGLIVTGNVMVDRTQLGEPGNVVIEDERNLDALSRWAKSTKDAGIPILVQLNHPGRQSNPLALGHTSVAPSPVALNLPGATTPRELTSAEIEDIIERFAKAATVCETAGFDGVQIHGAHGYLVAQFLSPLSNQRDDEWGGNPERRMRFVLEVVRRIRARVSPGFAVGIKLNSADFQRGGFTEAESRSVVAALAHEGIDLIEVSGGSYEQPAMMGKATDSTRTREAYFLEYARTVRSLAGDIPLAVTGGFRSRAAMQEAVYAGECDVIGLGRPTATTTNAAEVILDGRAATLPSHHVRTGMRPFLRKFVDLKSLDGILELSWHTDQLHRVGAGLKPDPNRGRIATTVAMLRRNGTTSFGRKRGL